MIEHGRQWIAALALTAGVLLVAHRVSGENAQSGGALGAAASTTRPADETRPVVPNSRDDVEGKAVSPGSGRGMWASVFRTVLALGVVAVMIFALRFLLKRFGGGWHGRRGSAPMSVLARTSVSARQQLLLVRLGRRLILVGSGPEGMAPLAEVSDPDEVAELVRLAEGPDKQGSPDDASAATGPPAGQREARP